jgi:hypothetical protein
MELHKGTIYEGHLGEYLGTTKGSTFLRGIRRDYLESCIRLI